MGFKSLAFQYRYIKEKYSYWDRETSKVVFISIYSLFTLLLVTRDVPSLHDIDCFVNREIMLAIYEIIINPAPNKDRRE
jgi:hypothetical protein